MGSFQTESKILNSEVLNHFLLFINKTEEGFEEIYHAFQTTAGKLRGKVSAQLAYLGINHIKLWYTLMSTIEILRITTMILFFLGSVCDDWCEWATEWPCYGVFPCEVRRGSSGPYGQSIRPRSIPAAIWSVWHTHSFRVLSELPGGES